jgi:hypothetical protein
MLKTLGDDPKRQRLHAGNGFGTVLSVCHHAGQGRDFGLVDAARG